MELEEERDTKNAIKINNNNFNSMKLLLQDFKTFKEEYIYRNELWRNRSCEKQRI